MSWYNRRRNKNKKKRYDCCCIKVKCISLEVTPTISSTYYEHEDLLGKIPDEYAALRGCPIDKKLEIVSGKMIVV